MLPPAGSVRPIPDPATLDLVPSPIWLIVQGEDRVEFNEAWVAMTGAPRTYSVRAWIADLIHPDDAARITAAWADANQECREFSEQYRLLVESGVYHSVLSRGRPVPTDDGLVWIGTLTDIEEQNRGHERGALLEAAHAAFAAHEDPDRLIDALLAFIVPRFADFAVVDRFDENGRFAGFAFAGPPDVRARVAASREAYARGAVEPGTSWWTALHGGTVFIPIDGIGPDVPEGTRALYERFGVASAIVVPLADGDRRYGALAVVRTDRRTGGYLPQSVPYYAEIAARTAAAITRAKTVRSLVESEQLYRTLADRLPQIVGLARADGTIFYLNERFREYTGHPTQPVEDAWSACIHPDDLPRLRREWAETLARGQRFETRYRLRRHDGVYRWFLNQALPVRDDRGAVASWVATGTDVDQMQRSENALRVAVEVGESFARTLNANEALQELADAAVHHLADWCGVYLFDGNGRLQPVALAHTDPARVRQLREYFRRFPIAPDDAIVITARTGRAERIGPISDVMLDAVPEDRREFVRSLGLHAVMNVPLAFGDERFGAFSLALAHGSRLFDDDDERLATMLAQRAAIALGNARLFERQREVARTLQSAFLPASLPVATGTAFDAVYVAGAHDLSVGGDWYDADLRADGWIAFSIGDIAGHGLEAAVPMGKMRQTFRTLAVRERDPSAAMLVADAMLRAEHPDVFATAFLGLFAPETGDVRYANAGHPLPFVREANAAVRRLQGAGIPLGLAPFGPPKTFVDQLAPESLLVAFTDGLIELERDIEGGERAIVEALAHPAFALCSTPAALLAAMLIQDRPQDDVAIFTMRVGRGADWSFDTGDEAGAHAARTDFVGGLRADGVPDAAAQTAELIFGEVVGNAVRYAPGVLDLALERAGNDYVLRALDRGPGFAWNASLPSDESESGRGLFLIERLARSVRSDAIPGFGTYIEIAISGTSRGSACVANE